MAQLYMRQDSESLRCILPKNAFIYFVYLVHFQFHHNFQHLLKYILEKYRIVPVVVPWKPCNHSYMLHRKFMMLVNQGG